MFGTKAEKWGAYMPDRVIRIRSIRGEVKTRDDKG
jgi:hypothetical protein